MTDVIPAHGIEIAPDEARAAMEAMNKNTGFVPDIPAQFAAAPALLVACQAAA